MQRLAPASGACGSTRRWTLIERRQQLLLSPPRHVSIRDAQCHKSLGMPPQRRLPPCCGAAAGGVMAQPQPGGGSSSSSSGWALGSLLTSKYDKEIVSVAVPALAAMLLEPIMGAINSGEWRLGMCMGVVRVVQGAGGVVHVSSSPSARGWKTPSSIADSQATVVCVNHGVTNFPRHSTAPQPAPAHDLAADPPLPFSPTLSPGPASAFLLSFCASALVGQVGMQHLIITPSPPSCMLQPWSASWGLSSWVLSASAPFQSHSAPSSSPSCCSSPRRK